MNVKFAMVLTSKSITVDFVLWNQKNLNIVDYFLFQSLNYNTVKVLLFMGSNFRGLVENDQLVDS